VGGDGLCCFGWIGRGFLGKEVSGPGLRSEFTTIRRAVGIPGPGRKAARLRWWSDHPMIGFRYIPEPLAHRGTLLQYQENSWISGKLPRYLVMKAPVRLD
jgi:hypothetical protein